MFLNCALVPTEIAKPSSELELFLEIRLGEDLAVCHGLSLASDVRCKVIFLSDSNLEIGSISSHDQSS